jgi:hypothetical protein
LRQEHDVVLSRRLKPFEEVLVLAGIILVNEEDLQCGRRARLAKLPPLMAAARRRNNREDT